MRITCPTCDGDGQERLLEPISVAFPGLGLFVRYITCRTCGGAGNIPVIIARIKQTIITEIEICDEPG